MAIKSRSYNFCLDPVKLSFEIVFMHQKSDNLAMRLILAVGMGYIETFEVSYKSKLSKTSFELL